MSALITTISYFQFLIIINTQSHPGQMSGSCVHRSTKDKKSLSWGAGIHANTLVASLSLYKRPD